MGQVESHLKRIHLQRPPRLKSEEMRRKMLDEARFFRGWLQKPLQIGAVSPSSRTLGRRMSSFVPMEKVAEGGYVLELGPGTGVVTACLIERGIPEDQLVLIEYSREFCVLLRARFPKAHIIEGDAYNPGKALDEVVKGKGLAAVVSSLPLFTRPERQRETLVDMALTRLESGLPFIQFSYAFTQPVKPERIGASLFTRSWIKRNLPPARVLVYRR
ncbi:class I SAM-dependent methyltransferase [Consotaella salsifontis]|uniref:Phosphatidylethanolamine/phosphatidyl-N-methylethanolamine N-methyltransferase n=1 Tax=Consotaella salsifontis TaxID=1365950 RepID=A0A1T4T9A7_9HYPH|nr:rRNA adenine N-6-methyltransferase family protein [Consotaella salsifontis]SKA36738.1 phosphatidylethanolamine/phosphatidyl-N-methylethanolamine N-methyltransferase [Consotaella salsifontis]